MIAMQYSFVLPADYDMSIIERRVRERGHVFDDMPSLAFKAFLIARKDGATPGRHENLYAPFYLWENDQAMTGFLCGPRFRAVVDAFGWPLVRTWTTMAAEQGSALGAARFATREIVPVAPFTSLDALRDRERRSSAAATRDEGALYALSAFEPTGWTVVRFRLWRDATASHETGGAQVYEVAHLSNPAGL
ncbi:DUF4865 family protein [Robbsia sp. Bb-Pol-6]|uniref:DUF4865 family protein n=1 Tax=Robbsia betulipollinis TaxID=2981849 RepID=A0ABT3ZK33_9BURK|nr:DUF4865 family protein [Robbsia betulipollinis]MCY0386640.1 DUF4865 family protein [Robbsia betulipollinis]